MKSTSLVRIRFTHPMLERLDKLGASIRTVVRRRVARAAIVRALVRLGLDSALVTELVIALKDDGVRRGRERGVPQRRRA